MTRDAYEALVHLAYDAPLHPEGFGPFLAALREATRSRCASLKWTSLTTGRTRIVSEGMDRSALDAYGEHFGAIDPWGQVEVAPGDDLFGDEMLPRSEVEASAFYADFGRAHGYLDIHKVVFEPTPERTQISLGLLKSERTKRGDGERRLTRRLAPHLQRALSLTAWKNDLEDQRAALTQALDASGRAVFFLDERARVSFGNRAAEALVRARDGLDVVAREIHAALPADEHRLRLHLASVDDDAMREPGPVFVTRPSGRAPYQVLALPLAPHHEDVAGLGIAKLLFVDDPEEKGVGPLLQTRYGLTYAETRVALRVARGQSPREIAAALDTSWHTVRTQLRAVYAKTDTGRQAALAALLSRLAR